MTQAEAKAAYEAAKNARDAEYWRFTRCARVSPLRLAELSKVAADAKRLWLDLSREKP